MRPRVADLLRAAPFDRVELDRAVTFLRGQGQQASHYRKPASYSERDFREVVAVEDGLRRELAAMTDKWRLIWHLTPRQISVLLALAIEGNAERAAARLCITPQTLKNHITDMRKRLYGPDYARVIEQSTSSSPLIALAVRWALESGERPEQV